MASKERLSKLCKLCAETSKMNENELDTVEKDQLDEEDLEIVAGGAAETPITIGGGGGGG